MDAGRSKATRQRPRKSRHLNLAAIESLMIAVTDLGDTVRETLGARLDRRRGEALAVHRDVGGIAGGRARIRRVARPAKGLLL